MPSLQQQRRKPEVCVLREERFLPKHRGGFHLALGTHFCHAASCSSQCANLHLHLHGFIYKKHSVRFSQQNWWRIIQLKSWIGDEVQAYTLLLSLKCFICIYSFSAHARVFVCVCMHTCTPYYMWRDQRTSMRIWFLPSTLGLSGIEHMSSDLRTIIHTIRAILQDHFS